MDLRTEAQYRNELAEVWGILHAERRANAWHPIDSAPKDGTEILGWRRDCGVLLVRWICPNDFCTEDELENMGSDSAEQEDWFCADFICGGRMEGDEAPTHWMPLPAPPNARNQPPEARKG